jgi:hypothetical protein
MYDNSDKINFYQNRLIITNDQNQDNKIISANKPSDNRTLINSATSIYTTTTTNDYDSIIRYDDINILLNDNNTTTPNQVQNTNNQANMVHLKAKKAKDTDTKIEQCRICGETSTTGLLGLLVVFVLLRILFQFCYTCVLFVGLHYGTVTCEACKKFFLRNTNTANDQLKCVRGTANCIVTKVTRTNCPYCRLKKCLSHGMDPLINRKLKYFSFRIFFFFFD